MSRYSSSLGKFRVGEEISVDDEVGELLMRDSPGSFTTKEPKAEKPAKAPAGEQPAIDVEAASVDELKAFAEAEGIELEADAGDEDIRAAVALALEERAKAKLETKETAGTKANTRPAPKNSRGR